jgi:hypothetical protein
MLELKVVLVASAAVCLAACGTVAEGPTVDGGDTDARHGIRPPGVDGEVGSHDAGPGAHDARRDSTSRTDAGAGLVDAGHLDGGGTTVTYVDAGYYRGDGSFFVDGGAYPDARTTADSSNAMDAGGLDATPGCAPLAACCSSLQGGSQSVCSDIASQGNATNCSTELTQLQSLGNCTGVSVLASQVQVTPNFLVSDGTLLFWTTKQSPGLLSMPVGGGAISVVLNGPISNSFGVVNGANPSFLAVDDVNIYVLNDNSFVRIPKSGGAASLVNEPGASVIEATTLGTTAYWVEESTPGARFSSDVIVRSAPLLGGAISSLGGLTVSNPYFPVVIGVTGSTVFLGGPGMGSPANLYWFSIAAGVPAAGPAATVQACTFLASDTGAVFCSPGGTSRNVAVAGNGSTGFLGPADNSSYIVSDDTFAYWADMTTVGTIMKAPKTGGGTAVVLARDANPTAIAVDANSVYWGDADGYIKSVPK